MNMDIISFKPEMALKILCHIFDIYRISKSVRDT